MARTIRWLVLVLALSAAVVAGVGLLLPTTWSVERAVTVRASPVVVAELVGDFRLWQRWALWTKDFDPTVEVHFEGRGPGAIYRWRGEAMGHGLLRTKELDPARGHWFEGEIDGDRVNLQGAITYLPARGGTRVTWQNRGDIGGRPIGGYFVRSLEHTTARQMELSLKKLKQEAETRTATITRTSSAAR